MRITEVQFKRPGDNNDNNNNNNEHPNKRQKNGKKEGEEEEKERDINDIVSPLWNKTYEEQIKIKYEETKKVIEQKLIQRIKQESKYEIPKWILNKETRNIPFEGVKQSPVIKGYRNKISFSIGYDKEGKKPVVGFVHGRSINGNAYIADPNQCTFIVSDVILQIRNSFQEYLNNSIYLPYNKATHTGFWRLIVIKSYTTDEIMVIVQVDPSGVDKEKIQLEISKLTNHFLEFKKNSNIGIKSINLQYNSGVSDVCNEPCELIYGDQYVHEKLMGLLFQISADAFFQVNSTGTEILYNIVKDWCIESAKELKTPVVLDVCCGTGTIGLSIANHVNKVIGIEMIENAVKDARVNAINNNITNATFVCGKAEDVLQNQLRTIDANSDAIAIIDPPRAGIHPKTIKAIRNCKAIQYLIFVSCDLQGLYNTSAGLCRSESNNSMYFYFH